MESFYFSFTFFDHEGRMILLLLNHVEDNFKLVKDQNLFYSSSFLKVRICSSLSFSNFFIVCGVLSHIPLANLVRACVSRLKNFNIPFFLKFSVYLIGIHFIFEVFLILHFLVQRSNAFHSQPRCMLE